MIATLLLALACQDAQDPAPAEGLRWTPIVFQANSGETVEAESARLSVPERRDRPTEKRIELALVRFRCTGEPRGAPIVYLAGGPGGSGIGAARGSRFGLFQSFRAVADVIALDQRGTGDSTPSLECSQGWRLPLDEPLDPWIALALAGEQMLAAQEELAERGIDLAGYNTRESADDLEDLRRALGAEKITLWGISYGTHLALATLRRHPESIERAILAGVEGPAHTLKLPSQVQAQLETVARLAAEDPEIGERMPDLLVRIQRLLERLEEEPMTAQVADGRGSTTPLVFGKADLQWAISRGMGNDRQQAVIPAYVQMLERGVVPPDVASGLLRTRSGSVGNAMRWAMDCASGASPERLERIDAEAEETLLGAWIDFPLREIRELWDVPDLGEEFRSPVRSQVPVLCISGTYDARTPPANAEEVLAHLPNGRHLVLEGATHSDPLFLSSPDIETVMLEFLRGEELSTTRIQLPSLRFLPLAE